MSTWRRRRARRTRRRRPRRTPQRRRACASRASSDDRACCAHAVIELVAVDRLEADLRLRERALDVRLLLPEKGDCDAAVRAHLARARHEPRLQVGALEDALGTHCVLRGEERHDPSPLQATVPNGSALRSLAAMVRTASTATSMSASVVSLPHEKRSVPSGAVPSERCAAGEQWSPARVMTPHSSSSSRATVAHGTPSMLSEAIPTLSTGSAAPYSVTLSTPATPSRKRRPSSVRRSCTLWTPTSRRCSAAAPRPTIPIAFSVPLS